MDPVEKKATNANEHIANVVSLTNVVRRLAGRPGTGEAIIENANEAIAAPEMARRDVKPRVRKIV
jgi:hypothetical protein